MGPCGAAGTALLVVLLVVHPTGIGSSGAGTRTPNNCSRGSCVADYTTPERANEQVSGSGGGCEPGSGSARPLAADPGVEVDEAVVADDPTDADGQRLVHEVAQRDPVGGVGGRAGVAVEADLGGD